MAWTKPDAVVGVVVELTLRLPASGALADLDGRAAAELVDASGAHVATRHVGLDTIKTLLSVAQQQALAGIMTTLRQEAITRLLDPA